MNFSANLNIIIPIIIVLVIVFTYYSYYSVKDMVKSEIKDFYIKTEKIKLKRDRQDKVNVQQQIIQQPMQKSQVIQQHQHYEQNQEPEFDMNDMSFLEMENENINNQDIESYIDPLRNEDINDKYKQNEKENNANQILADRIFNL